MKILCTIGTRPEAIKMAPVILALQKEAWASVRVLATAQHREMLDQVLNLFGIVPDIDLNIMRTNQSLPELTARLFTAMDEALAAERPDAVLAQGDTTTVLVAAMAAFYRRIPFGHIEAGLRTGDLYNPFPEEMNRVVAGRLSRWHFAPTLQARANLLREGIPAASIHVSGNTVIDALLSVAHRENPQAPAIVPEGQRLVLVTAHRRENFGAPFRNICRAIRLLVEEFPDIQVLFPVHPNPNIRHAADEELAGQPRIVLTAPLDYVPFVQAMRQSYLILSDSGGVQEEAPALGKPVLVLREETERPEALAAGVVQLVGTDPERIVATARQLLRHSEAYRAMAKGVSPYGDGKAARRIVSVLGQAYGERVADDLSCSGALGELCPTAAFHDPPFPGLWGAQGALDQSLPGTPAPADRSAAYGSPA